MCHIQEWCGGESELVLGEYERRALQDLGLTLSQTKVYLTLVSIGNLTARQVSFFAEVARQDIYRILTELHERGLVEKIICTPTKFAALPMQEAISILMECKINETAELQNRTRELLQRVATNVKASILEEKQQFILISEKHTLINRIKKSIKAAKEKIEFTSSAKVFPNIVFTLAEDFKEAMANGVEIRYIVHKSEDTDSWPENVETFTKNPLFKLKTLFNSPDTRCGIFDYKEMFIATYPSRGAFQSPVLWSNNPNLIVAIQDHFEKNWLKAKENEP
jgi:sugar-specific transcriptional regulator TrmB